MGWIAAERYMPRRGRWAGSRLSATAGVTLCALVGALAAGPLAGSDQQASSPPVRQDIAAVNNAPAPPAEPLSYNRDIRPILSDKCFSCHGPDNEHRAADLRLDTPDNGENYEGAYFAIVPGDPEASEVVSRIHSTKSRLVMPPPKSKLTLTDEEKKLIERWIKEGAKYESHWSFITPKRPALPEVRNQQWVRNAIDPFVLAHLEAKRIEPSREADKPTLLRRLTLDLTGLPPTAEELDAFLADESDDAYEKAVDRLLASPRFGERMALPWLDAARYADTNGFSIDDHRDMWLWREWVIDAFNRNLPYDQFVIKQLAGDLLPGSTQSDKLATGFLRNSMNTHEGGTIPAEYRVIYIADKVDTVSTVFMGLTMQCAQCHDHKYDPISMDEYYQMYAFFDTAHEPGKGATNDNTPPVIRMDGPITDNATWKRDVEQRIATLERYLVHPPELVEERAAWEQRVIASAEGELAAALKTPAGERTDAQWQAINAVFKPTVNPLWDRHVSTIKREIAVLEKDLKAGQSSVMVMKEQGPRQTYVLTRGQYDQPDKDRPVSPGVPGVLPPMEPDVAGANATRLDLAKWLVDPDHPLTSRVAVNRYWQMLFGRGLVPTPNDLGMQGSYPTHPDLLDWLASEYLASGWDTKHMIKLMVMSATYRQSSSAPRTVIENDPNNVMLARAPRFRLPAEFIRDGALAIAGELDDRVGGPSVYPSQPHGLWREVSHFGYGNAFSAQAFYPSDASGQTRRSMYTFWKRTSPPPSLAAFDAPTREVCTVERSRTNTPLQALVLLNDPEYIDAARALAKLVIEQGGETDAKRIDYLFRRATARLPEADERALLLDRLNQALSEYNNNADATHALAQTDSPRLAAWTVVASVVLNLDETITRE
ncbi:MAG: PSD1 and planctomycete cytochrome C domain-containing protein [Phycisphaeraceae bacterium]